LDDSLPFLELIRRDLIRWSRGEWEMAQTHDASVDVTILPTRPFDLVVTALVMHERALRSTGDVGMKNPGTRTSPPNCP